MAFQLHDLRQTIEWAGYLRSIGWTTERLATSQKRLGNFLYIRKIPLLPVAVAKLQRPIGEVDWQQVFQVCKKHRVVILYYEPSEQIENGELKIDNEQELRDKGFRKSGLGFLPRKTIWIDLQKADKQLLFQMKAKTRYNIGLAKRRGITIKIFNFQFSNNQLQDDFFRLLKHNAKRLGIFALPREWYEAQINTFGKKCFAVLAYFDDELIAGNFFMCSSNACFYSHNGSTELGRKLMAPSLCVWEGIREAKRRKLKVFDFDGVDDGSRSLIRWKGFTRFKAGFGGNKVEFEGQYWEWFFPSFR